MRSTWLAVALLVAGCFSEAPSSSDCVDGEAACDCRPGGACDVDLECIASIDKCVPTGCTPGSGNCTCVDGDCLGELVCSEGVCTMPGGATTGSSASTSGPISDATTNPMASASTDPSLTDSDPGTTVVETGTTDESMSGSVSTDPTNPTVVSESVSDSDTSVESCPACIDTAGQNDCSAQYNACLGNRGCNTIRMCVLNFGNVVDCCNLVNQDGATSAWNVVVECAQMFNCDGTCDAHCG